MENEKSKEAYSYLIKLLTKRDYSEYKLKQKLRERGFSAEDTESAIQKVKDKDYLKEENYTEARVKGLMHKGMSPSYIQQKLREEKIELEINSIIDIFTEYDYCTERQIKYLAEKKLRFKTITDKYKTRDKVLSFVLGKGHEFSESKSIIENILQI